MRHILFKKKTKKKTWVKQQQAVPIMQLTTSLVITSSKSLVLTGKDAPNCTFFCTFLDTFTFYSTTCFGYTFRCATEATILDSEPLYCHRHGDAV